MCFEYILIENEKKEDKKEKKIQIKNSIKKDIDKYFKINIENTETLLSFLKKKYTINTNRVGFSLRKLAEKYYNETGKSVSHVTINNALKRLGMHYLKLSPKTNENLMKIIISYDCIKNS